MELMGIIKIISDEEKTINYLQEKGLLRKYNDCPYCMEKILEELDVRK